MRDGGRTVRGATSKSTHVQKAGKMSRSRLREEPILESALEKDTVRTSAVGIHRLAKALLW